MVRLHGRERNELLNFIIMEKKLIQHLLDFQHLGNRAGVFNGIETRAERMGIKVIVNGRRR